MRFHLDRTTEPRPIAPNPVLALEPSLDTAAQFTRELNRMANSLLAENIQQLGTDHVFHRKNSNQEYDEAVTQLARDLGFIAEDVAPRQKSRSKRLRKHNTADDAAHRETLRRTKPELLKDRDLFPQHRPVPKIRPKIETPINHPSLCTGELEPIFREEFNLPSIAEEQCEPFEVVPEIIAPYARPILDCPEPVARWNETTCPPPNPYLTQRLTTYQLAISRHRPDAESLLSEFCNAAGIPAPSTPFGRN